MSSHRPPVRAKIIGSTSRWVLRCWAFGVGEVDGELGGEGAGLAVPVTTVSATPPDVARSGGGAKCRRDAYVA